ncbi:MAG: hypothetical protein B6U68_02645, partial [Candidatus Aenigmarchaeota archaeon ex4484_14]
VSDKKHLEDIAKEAGTLPEDFRKALTYFDVKDVDIAAFTRKHPYIATPEIMVKSRNPKKSLLNAVKKIKLDVTSLKKQAERDLTE